MFSRFLSLFLLAFISSCATVKSADSVKVELYYESQWPGCQSFTTGPLKDTLAKSDIAAIVSLKLVAYGNTKMNADGTFTCQHGTGECDSDVLELCTQYKLSGNINSISTGDTSMAAWPFILCMEEAEGKPEMGQSCYESTMNATVIPWSTISKCASTEADTVQNAAASATPAHDYVPWVLVDGVLLEHSDMLQYAICSAYTGIKPASCKKTFFMPQSACPNK